MIDIVIVNWNGGRYITNCVNSINRHSDNLVEKIIVVDNNSNDRSDYQVESLANVQLLRQKKNLGFAKASNIGASNSKNKYLLFLNPDTLIYRNTLKKVFSFMEAKENINTAICGVQQRNSEGTISRHSNRYPSLISFLCLTVGLTSIFPKLGHVMREWDHNDSRKVDHVIGSFYFIRRNIFISHKGFDERFFMYLEDLDLSCRVKKNGLDTMYLSDVYITHFCGGSSKKVKSHRLFYSLTSRLMFVEKYFGKLGFSIIFMGMFSVELLLRLIRAVSAFSLNLLMEVLLGYGLIVNSFLKSLKNIFFR